MCYKTYVEISTFQDNSNGIRIIVVRWLPKTDQNTCRYNDVWEFYPLGLYVTKNAISSSIFDLMNHVIYVTVSTY